MGTYSILAEVSYKGFTYLSTTSNEFFIQSDEAVQMTGVEMKVRKYPINRDYDSIYTVKIPNPTNFIGEELNQDITTVEFKLPDSLEESSYGLSCFPLDQTFSENYLNLMVHEQTTQIDCEINNGIIKVSNIQEILHTLGSDDFLRFSFHKLKNPDLSSAYQSMDVTFIDESTGTGSVIASTNVHFPSRISGPPSNLQMNSISTASTKLLVSTDYTFSISTVVGETVSINANSHIGLILIFPSEYKEIWYRLNENPDVTLTLGSDDYTSEAHLINGTIIVEYNTLAAVDFSDILVEFEFINPNRALDCTQVPVFTISLFDFTLNSIIAETLGNNIECPEFSNKLFEVNISGSSQMEAGTVYEYTVSIEESAEYL